MSRKIKKKEAVLESIPVQDPGDLRQWLEVSGSRHNLRWLLAHADDGIIWGRLDGGKLVTSHEAALGNLVTERVCPPLRPETLHQARLFGPPGELLLWRDGDNGWQARLIRDAAPGESTEWDEAQDEPQMLWGTRGEPIGNGFTLLTEGERGLRHALPMGLSADSKGAVRVPKLIVRHYLNKEGFARIVASRLVGFETEDAHE